MTAPTKKKLVLPVKVIHRLINIFFVFALIFVFIIVAKAGDHIRISVALILAAMFALTAFLLNWLTLDGSLSAAIFGIIIYGLGDWPAALLGLTFFVTASLLSSDTESMEEKLSVKFRRNGNQVWANGFWFALWVMLWFITKEPIFMATAAASIAAANADTWATEVGNKFTGKTILINNFEEVQKGTDGGVSIQGTLAALAGASLIALIYWITSEDTSFTYPLFVLLSGFAGSFIDSFLGAKYQGRKFSLVPYRASERGILLDNNLVNWLSIGFSSTIMLILTLII